MSQRVARMRAADKLRDMRDRPTRMSLRSWRATDSIECNDAADGFAPLQRRKAIIDPLKRDAAGDQLVEQQRAVEIGAREQRKIPSRPRVAITDAADALLLHQRTPAKCDILVDVDLAEPDEMTAGAHRLGGHPESRRTAGRLDHHIDAA